MVANSHSVDERVVLPQEPPRVQTAQRRCACHARQPCDHQIVPDRDPSLRTLVALTWSSSLGWETTGKRSNRGYSVPCPTKSMHTEVSKNAPSSSYSDNQVHDGQIPCLIMITDPTDTPLIRRKAARVSMHMSSVPSESERACGLVSSIRRSVSMDFWLVH